MAKSKSARGATGRKAAQRSAKKAARPRVVKGSKQARKAAKPKAVPAGRRAGPKGRAAKKSAKKVAAKSTTRKVAKPVKKVAAKRAATAPKASARKATPRRAPTLDRARRTVTDAERFPSPPSSLNMDRSASAARTGRAELAERLQEHTSTSPAMTGGDVDADWESAATVGDEAPGGDNPTPDQDVVDEIGKALGIEYDDDEELQGGEEILERDKKRWELDPASSDDFDDRD